MSTADLLIIFGPMLALSVGYAIMFAVHSYGVFKGYWS
jgi:hypothetical protein